MTRTTALATMLLLAALPAAAQSFETGAFEVRAFEGAGPEASTASTGLMASEGTAVFYSGPMIGLPSLTDTRPSSAGDLPGPAFFTITEPVVALNHLDFGAYEPYEPKRSREVLKDIANEKATNRAAHDGVNDVAVSVDGTPGRTKLGTSYTTTTGPVDWQARAGVVAPGVQAMSEATTEPLHSPDIKMGVKYKF
jgi:hypothetical protein